MARPSHETREEHRGPSSARAVALVAGSEGPPATAPSLREQHHELTRELILRAVVEQLEQGEIGDVTVPDVARAAGVSVRTVYRHFPTREELLAAASAWIAETFFSESRLPERLDEIPPQLVANWRSFDERPNLARAMAITRAGNAVRWVRRERRMELMRRALRDEIPGLSPAELRRADAVFGHLINMLAWVTMRDENGLSGEEAGEAIGWAFEVLLEDLRRRSASRGQDGAGKSTPEE